MPLSLAQKEGLEAILNRLSNEDIISLSNTVTGGLLKAESKNEAVQGILLHTDHPAELLSRRKVKAETLMSYLHDLQVPTQGVRAKPALVNIVLQHWSATEPQLKQKEQSRNEELQKLKTEFTESVREILAEANTYRHQILNSTGATIEHFCQKFACWFYHMLNSVNPRWLEKSADVFGCSHFWSDCTLNVIFEEQKNIDDMHKELSQTHGSQDVAEFLQDMILKYDVAFNPNTTSEGLSGKVDKHGLVMVCVYGTVHKPLSCIGVFQQVFGLISDPADGKWKIKHTNLLFRVQQLQEIPSVKDVHRILEIAAN